MTNGTTGQKRIAQFKEYFEEMSVEGKPTVNQEAGVVLPPPDDDGSDGPIFTVGASPPPEPDFPIAGDPGVNPITGMIDLEFSGGKSMRRMFLAEFDELYDAQREKDALVREWDRLNNTFPRGWTIQDLLDELHPDLGNIHVTPTRNGGSSGGTTTTGATGYPTTQSAPTEYGYTTGNDDDDIDPTGPMVIGGEASPPPPGPTLSEENAARKAVLDGLLAVYTIADAYECLDEGLTYCEFSLKEFSQSIVGHADEETQDAYERCLDFLPSPFANNLGVRRWFINPEQDLLGFDLQDLDAPSATLTAQYNHLMSQGCSYRPTSPMTTTKFKALVAKTKSCESKIPAYQTELAAYLLARDEEIALQAARARLAAIPELYDAATGRFKKPGTGSAYDEFMGGKYFGLGMHYDYSFNTNVPNDLCDFEIEAAGGEFSAYANILTSTQPLIDVGAWIRTEEGQIDFHAEIRGTSIFVGNVETTENPDNYRLWVNFVDDNRSASLFSHTTPFALGPIPMSLTVGAAGEIGYKTDFDAGVDLFDGMNAQNHCPEAYIGATLEPYMGVNGFVELGLDIGIAKAGVRGEMTIIRVSIPVSVDATTTFEAEDGTPNIVFDVDFSAKAKFTTLAGALSVYLELGRCPHFCKRFSKQIVGWDGLTWDKQLFHHTYNVGVADLILAGAQ